MSTPAIAYRLDVPALTDDLRSEIAACVTPGWQAHGACRYVADDAWFPDLTEPSRRSAAVAACTSCPVRRSCLAYALSENEDHGIWGGTTEVQRDALNLDLARGVSVRDVLDSATIRPAHLWRRTG